MEQWWSEKYKRPPNHPLYQNRTVGDLKQEMWEDLYQRKNELEKQLDDAPMDEREHIMESLRGIYGALGIECDGEDDLIDQWERELEEGLTPDLNEGL